MIEKLIKGKKENYFKPEEWSERGLNPSDESRQQEMRQVMDDFFDSAIKTVIDKGAIDEQDVAEIISQLENGPYDDFDTEEREWIYMTILGISGDLGLNIGEIVEPH